MLRALRAMLREGTWMEKRIRANTLQASDGKGGLGPGTCFGETGLLDHAPRSASATTRSACDFLIINRDDFNKAIRDEIKKATIKQVQHLTRQLLREFDFFRKLSEDVQDSLPSIMRFTNYPKGSAPFLEGDPPGHCYILLEGEVALWGKSHTTGKSREERRTAATVRRTTG